MDTSESVKTVADGEFPFYVTDPEPEPDKVELKTSDIPQGSGSNLDSDTVDGFQAARSGPNKLLVTSSSGLLPSAAIPQTGWQVLSSTGMVSATSATVSGLLPGNAYRVTVRARQNTSAGRIYVRFNGDSGANYEWIIGMEVNGPSHGSDQQGGVTDNQIYFSSGARTVLSGAFSHGGFEFTADPSDSTRVCMTGRMTWNRNSNENAVVTSYVGGYYDGASDLSSVTVGTSAGTLTGNILVEYYTF